MKAKAHQLSEPYHHHNKMKIVISRKIYVDGEPVQPGDVLDVKARLGKHLILTGAATEYVSEPVETEQEETEYEAD